MYASIRWTRTRSPERWVERMGAFLCQRFQAMESIDTIVELGLKSTLQAGITPPVYLKPG